MNFVKITWQTVLAFILHDKKWLRKNNTTVKSDSTTVSSVHMTACLFMWWNQFHAAQYRCVSDKRTSAGTCASCCASRYTASHTVRRSVLHMPVRLVQRVHPLQMVPVSRSLLAYITNLASGQFFFRNKMKIKLVGNIYRISLKEFSFSFVFFVEF